MRPHSDGVEIILHARVGNAGRDDHQPGAGGDHNRRQPGDVVTRAVLDRDHAEGWSILLLEGIPRCYGGREIDSLDRIREIADRIPEIERVIVVPYLRSECDIGSIRAATLWDDFVSSPGINIAPN